MGPGQGLGRDLLSAHLVNLLVNSAAIVLHVGVNSGQHRVSSTLGSSHKVRGSRILSKVEYFFPGFMVGVGVTELEVSTGLDLLLHLACSIVEQFSEGSGQELPGVSVGVVVAGVSTNQNAGNLSAIIGSVDSVFVAEDGVVVLDSGSSLAGERPVDTVREGSNGVDSGAVNSMGVVSVTIVGLSDVSSVPVLVQRVRNVTSNVQVIGCGVFLANRFSEIGGSFEGVDEAHTSPEEIGVSSFFPEITSVGLPVGGDPGHVVGNQRPDIILGCVSVSLLHKDASPVG